MAQKRTPGLLKIGQLWHIDKRIHGQRICESTGTGELKEAERYLVQRLESIRQAKVYGIRPKRIFREAATKFLLENQHKRSIADDASRLKGLDSFIGNTYIELIHQSTLEAYIQARRQEGRKAQTINHGLKVVRHILNLAAQEWRDEYGLTWLQTAPKIKLLPQHDVRPPYPLSWEAQAYLFASLPPHLRDMALFGVNTGCRDGEICNLRWDWEVKVPIQAIGSVFIIPGEWVKNGRERLVVLNTIAREVIEQQRGRHPEFVFTYRQRPIQRMLNSGWRRAREARDLSVRVHDLKHTFGRRLRAAGVSFEDRQDLLGHLSARITTHYSSAELLNLWQAANKVCNRMDEGKSEIATLVTPSPEKVPNAIFLLN